jgi:hypothetical protein
MGFSGTGRGGERERERERYISWGIAPPRVLGASWMESVAGRVRAVLSGQ